MTDVAVLLKGTFYLFLLVLTVPAFELNPFLLIGPLDGIIFMFLFLPDIQDSPWGWMARSCRLDRWLGTDETCRLTR